MHTTMKHTMRASPPWLVALAGCLTLTTALLLSPPMDASSVDSFDWSTITPSRNLSYAPCYSGYQCARLLVPLDYSNLSSPSSSSATAALALIKLPAAVPPSHPAFAGPVLTNPGGPSDSGVRLALDWAAGMRDILDVPGQQHYEIVSWDPRGVGLTTPRADCYGEENKFARSVDQIREDGFGGFASAGGYDVAKRVAMAVGRSELCARSEGVGYMSTASTARDMVEIIDAIAGERKRQEEEEEEEEANERNTRVDLRKRTVDDKKDPPRLQYLGFSYGTFLGYTFASMFPGRVGRLILDGVVDGDDYLAVHGWLTNLGDTDKVAAFVWDECFAAGLECPIFRPTDTSGESIGERVLSLLRSLDTSPHTFIPPAPALPRVITGIHLRRWIAPALYTPITNSRPVMQMLADAMVGNYTQLAAWLDGPIKKELPMACDGSGGVGKFVEDGGGVEMEALSAIMCGEALPGPGDAGYWMGYAREQMEMSEYFGEWWVDIRLGCANWRVTPEYRFTGPFQSPAPSSTDEANTPAAPILFLTTELDPVTPMRDAFRMAEGFPGSSVVVQRGGGHCALRSSPSACTEGIVREYMRSGRVPAMGEVCEADCRPWSGDETCRAFRPYGSL